MRTKSHINDLEDRIARIEATISAHQLPSQTTLASEQLESLLQKVETALSADHSEEMSELSDMRNQLNRQLAFQNDRIASLALKLDMTHSRVERVDRVQDEVRQTQGEHESTLGEILDRLECQTWSLQSEMLTVSRGGDRRLSAAAPLF
jgi:peptidoglycan hydrolase CwlO-like protein